jgi:hypothetical protein
MPHNHNPGNDQTFEQPPGSADIHGHLNNLAQSYHDFIADQFGGAWDGKGIKPADLRAAWEAAWRLSAEEHGASVANFDIWGSQVDITPPISADTFSRVLRRAFHAGAGTVRTQQAQAESQSESAAVVEAHAKFLDAVLDKAPQTYGGMAPTPEETAIAYIRDLENLRDAIVQSTPVSVWMVMTDPDFMPDAGTDKYLKIHAMEHAALEGKAALKAAQDKSVEDTEEHQP